MPKLENTIIMHISDMHFGIPEKRQAASDRKVMLDTFIDCFAKLLKFYPKWAPNILVISGDIAWSGSVEDYIKAEEFFRRFLKIEGNKISPSNVVVCFGNHDSCADPFMVVDSDYNSIASDNKLQKLVKRPPSDTKGTSEARALDDKYALMNTDIEAYFHRFENAENFCNNMGFTVLSNSSTNRIYRHAYGSCIVEGIHFICLNTEWDFWGSKDKTAKGSLRIGAKLYHAANDQFSYTFYPFKYGMPPRFVVFHRSLEHLHKIEQYSTNPHDNDKCVGNLIHQNDVSLNGHEHNQYIERFGAHTRILAGTVHSTDALEFNCNLIAIPKKLKPNINDCEVRKFYYSPSNPYDHWQIDRFAERFGIVRFKGDRVSEFITAVTGLKDARNAGSASTHTDTISRLIPMLTVEDTAVLIAYLSEDVFRVILENVKASKQTEIQFERYAPKEPNPIPKPAPDIVETLRHGDSSIDTEQSFEKDQSLTKTLSIANSFKQNIPTGDGFLPYHNSALSHGMITKKNELEQ